MTWFFIFLFLILIIWLMFWIAYRKDNEYKEKRKANKYLARKYDKEIEEEKNN